MGVFEPGAIILAAWTCKPVMPSTRSARLTISAVRPVLPPSISIPRRANAARDSSEIGIPSWA